MKVSAYTGADELADALKGVDLVVIPAGVPRKPGMTRDDLFNINAGIVKNLVEAIADHAPNVSSASTTGIVMICGVAPLNEAVVVSLTEVVMFL